VESSARLGPTRVPDNAQPAFFHGQVAMYLAARLAGWSTTAIGKFYHGRDHSTVCYGIQRVEALRETDPEVDALLAELKQKLAISSQGLDQGSAAESEQALEKPKARPECAGDRSRRRENCRLFGRLYYSAMRGLGAFLCAYGRLGCTYLGNARSLPCRCLYERKAAKRLPLFRCCRLLAIHALIDSTTI